MPENRVISQTLSSGILSIPVSSASQNIPYTLNYNIDTKQTQTKNQNPQLSQNNPQEFLHDELTEHSHLP